jgi:hypothetical protein
VARGLCVPSTITSSRSEPVLHRVGDGLHARGRPTSRGHDDVSQPEEGDGHGTGGGEDETLDDVKRFLSSS